MGARCFSRLWHVLLYLKEMILFLELQLFCTLWSEQKRINTVLELQVCGTLWSEQIGINTVLVLMTTVCGRILLSLAVVLPDICVSHWPWMCMTRRLRRTWWRWCMMLMNRSPHRVFCAPTGNYGNVHNVPVLSAILHNAFMTVMGLWHVRWQILSCLLCCMHQQLGFLVVLAFGYCILFSQSRNCDSVRVWFTCKTDIYVTKKKHCYNKEGQF